MPPRKRGGHVQGNQTTLVTTVPPNLRGLVEEEAERKKETLSDVTRRALSRYFGVPDEDD